MALDLDLGAIWDGLVASKPPLANTTTSRGRRRLRLFPEPAEKRLLPTVERHPSGITPPLRLAIRQAVTGEAAWPLVAIGPAGIGKTCAALSLLDYAYGDYLTASGLAEKIIAAQQGRLETESGYKVGPEKLWAAWKAEPLVVLDELASRDRVSDHHYECVKRLIDDRQGKPFFVASNLDLAAIAKIYDDRIASRLAAGTVIVLDGPDRRLSDA